MSSIEDVTDMADFRALREARKRGAGVNLSYEDILAGLKARMENMDHILEPFAKQIYRSNRTPTVGKPSGSILIAGLPATGKTALFEAAAEVVFGTSTALYTIPCGQYQDQTFKNGVFGAPPQYAGGEGLLTQAILRHLPQRRGFVLFDEIEKPALQPGGYIKNAETFQSFYEPLDKGRYVDSHTQREVDCSGVFFGFTTNAEQEEGAKAAVAYEADPDELKDKMLGILKDKPFPDAFLDRVRIVTATKPHTEDGLVGIFYAQLRSLVGKFKGMRLATRSELPPGIRSAVDPIVWDEAIEWHKADPAKRTPRAFPNWIGQSLGLEDSLDELHLAGRDVVRIEWDETAKRGRGGVRAVAVDVGETAAVLERRMERAAAMESDEGRTVAVRQPVKGRTPDI